MSDLQVGLTSLVDAIPAYETAQRYYDGNTEETFHGERMQRELAKSRANNLRINFAKTAVDTVANRVEIAGVTSPDDAAQQALEALWAANELDLELPTVFTKALMFGDAYLLLDGDEENGVKLFYNSPLIMRMVYSQENPREKAFAIKRWQIADPASDKGFFIRVNLYYNDRVERYITAKSKAKGVKANEFVPFTGPDEDDDNHVVENPYGFIPVYHFRSARPYGMPEHKEAYGAQDAINKLAITHLATIDYLGFPQRYVMANSPLGSAEIDDFDADVFHDQAAPNATEVGVDMWRTTRVPHSGLTADPGGVWSLPTGSTAGQFPAADSKNFLDSIQTYIKIMAQVTTTPMHYFDPQGGTPSGESLRTADAPLVKKVRTREASFAGTLADCLQDALSLLGIASEVAVHWASATTSDDLDTWNVVKAKIDAGVAPRQALAEAGYTDDQLDAMGITDNAKLSLAERAILLQEIGKGVQGLSYGVTAGIVSQAQVQAMVEAVLATDLTRSADAAPEAA